jgi:hypothetical protein
VTMANTSSHRAQILGLPFSTLDSHLILSLSPTNRPQAEHMLERYYKEVAPRIGIVANPSLRMHVGFDRDPSYFG